MDEGSILRTLSYNGPPGAIWLVDSTTIEATPELMNAAELGLIQDGISPSDVVGSCSTGNCTFGLYTTLGVCSSVEDVTPSIVELPCPPDYHEKYDNVYNCPYTVSDLQQKPPVPLGSFVAGHNTLFIASSRTYEAHYPDLSTLVEFYVIYQPDVETPLPIPLGEGEMSFNESMLVALKGTLSLCSYTYNSSMESGVTTTTVVSKNTNLPWINDTDHSVLRATIDSRPTPETLSIDEASLKSMTGWAQSGIFIGNASMGGVADSCRATRYAFTTTPAELTYSPPHLFTRSFRASTQSPSHAHGPATTSEIYVSVHWAWLVAPILSIPLTLAFLAATIARSRQLRIPAWKSSQFASLMAMDPQTRAALQSGMQAQRCMEERVRESAVDVQLTGRGGGKWELGKVD